MEPYITRGPPADGGNPVDRDLHPMSDDGGPVGPDPARWSDPVWQGDAGQVRPQVFSAPDAGTVTVSQPEASPADRERSSPWASVRVEGNAAGVWTAHRSHAANGDLD